MLVSSTSRTRRSSIDDVEITHRYHARLLTQTLELLYGSGVLVFAEYSEFVSAFSYGFYTLSAFHLPNAKYSLCFIGLSDGEFWNSVGNCALYACLEGCTLYFFFQLVRAKFGISTLYQLGFVLEKYWMSIQGKLISSLVLVFLLHTVHQGTNYLNSKSQLGIRR
ncbi:hypothetical protein PHYSODRAFT_492690 [Phytophthora sojae]|uniref:Uncharacterized protein n=1 Tax=Phytophthora sojae (strain P6497) TaxID=1094619 RepID=G4Z3I0_PHYSP|nr:hypothetical protein PHYSODRAFT_492690 [Phytophthora sojae]EGZ19352.1 hypothetical protein PHYSODRAFT_492690 [Phytophthora sojae]|eukprot:XP_009522069.1 hypothetical protein PHYSODRAFT_492690 [Phytophthora sojae]